MIYFNKFVFHFLDVFLVNFGLNLHGKECSSWF